MAKKFTFVPGADTTVIFKNPAVVEENGDVSWNTGLNSADGEDATVNINLVSNPKILKKTAQLRLYRSNQFIDLAPGESVELGVKTSAELAYYVSIEDTDILVLENRDDFVTEGGESI